MHQTISDSFNQTLLESQSRIMDPPSKRWEFKSANLSKTKRICEHLTNFLKDYFSLLIILIVLINMGIKIYLYDWKSFSLSEYGIFIQVLLICSIGIMKSSILGGKPNITSIFVTIACSWVDLRFVFYLGKFIR